MNLIFSKNIIKKINKINFSKKTDEELKQISNSLRKRAETEKEEKLLPEAFALVKEAAKRTLGLTYFDVQLLGGYVLSKGNIAEMSTGAGKTLTAVLALYLKSLFGKSHLVTVNDYLAKRDCEWMFPVYEMLGVSCGYIIHETPREERKELYNKDVLYITNTELGFDYLRDNMAKDLSELVQNNCFDYAIIDEADSILIDEARTPLIISSNSDKSTDIYVVCNRFVKTLKQSDILKDEESRIWTLTESGVKRAENYFKLENYSDSENTLLRHHIEQAIKANYTMHKDKEYIVKDGQVIIIDEHTGRIAEGRRFNEGLHQAIEAKEGVKVNNESTTLASITYQNFFKQYKCFSGMTGTAMTEKSEFKEIYNLDVIHIPDNVPCIRKDNKDLIYVSEKAKIDAIVKDIKEQYNIGRPVLIGTLDIKKSEELSSRLTKEGIKHNLLNAKQNEQEAEIVAQAGQRGSITIATNMAGRGTDIKLGEGVKELGGLKIIASERAVDRRIDNQLIGRAGRQGDPGESQFYLSFDDELMEYATGSNKEKLIKLNKDDPDPVDSGIFTNLIYQCQRKIESSHFNARKNTAKYDKILNNQRINIYEQRNFVLNNDCTEIVLNMINPVMETELNKLPEDKKFSVMKQIFNIDASSLDDLKEKANEKITDYINNLNDKTTLSKIILYVVDAYWVRHMEDMQLLRQDVSGAAYRNEDPVRIYNVKGTEYFEEMNYNIKKDVIRNILINI